MVGHCLAVNRVGLGHDGHDRLVAHLSQLGGDVAVPGADFFIGRQAESNNVHFGEGICDEVVQALAQQGAGPVQPRRVDQDKLKRLPVDDATNGVPGGLWLGRGDGDLLTHQRIGQC